MNHHVVHLKLIQLYVNYASLKNREWGGNSPEVDPYIYRWSIFFFFFTKVPRQFNKERQLSTYDVGQNWIHSGNTGYSGKLILE